MTRNQKLIWIFGSISFVGLSYLGYRAIKRNQVYKLLINKIGQSSLTDNNRAVEVLNGIHHTKINSSRPFVMLNEADKRKVAEQIREAVQGLGTDEDDLKSALQGLKDNVAISQVASYYKGKYSESLYTRIDNEGELQEALLIVNSKPDVRWL